MPRARNAGYGHHMRQFKTTTGIVTVILVASIFVMQRGWRNHTRATAIPGAHSANLQPEFQWTRALGNNSNTCCGPHWNTTGKLIWTQQFGDKWQISKIAVGEAGTDYVIAEDPKVDFDYGSGLFAFKSTTGATLWQIKPGFPFGGVYYDWACFDPKQNKVVITTMSGDFDVINSHGDIEMHRKHEQDMKLPEPIVGSDHTVYTATNLTIVEAIDPITSKARWISNIDEPVNWNGSFALDPHTKILLVPCVGKGSGYALTGSLVALDATSGKVLWRCQSAFESADPILASSGAVIARLNDLSLLDIHSGNVLRFFEKAGKTTPKAVALDSMNRLYATDGDGTRILVYSAVSGKLLRQYKPCGTVTTKYCVSAHGRLYYGTTAGRIYCIYGPTGKTIWSLKLRGTPTGRLAIDSDGLILVHDNAGNLYKVG